MRNRLIAATILALGLGSVVFFSMDREAEQGPPNVLLILLDDLGNNDLGAFGEGSLQTPHIDKLASEGVMFTRHYADATCRPARAALLTGMMARRIGVPPFFRGISPEIDTLPEVLKSVGYSTRHIGKWHVGDLLGSSSPHEHGFDHWFGFMAALGTRYGDISKPGSTYFNPYLQSDGEVPEQQEGHMTDLFTQATIKAIETAGELDQPWFINLWYFAPHGPVQPAKRYARQFPDTGEGRYRALVTQLDDAIASIREALQRSGQADETLIVLLSDNGGTQNDFNSNAPFHGRKTSYLEGGLRTPLIILPPDGEPQRTAEAVFIRDLMPTILGFAGATPPAGVTGRDLAPLLRGESVAKVDAYFWDIQLPDFLNWGYLDLAGGQLHNVKQVQDWDPEAQRFGPPRTSSDAEFAEANAAYLAWREEIREVPLKAVRRKHERVAYLGDSYRRSPGYGPWSLQVPIELGAEERVVMRQRDLLDIEAHRGKLSVSMPGFVSHSETSASGCRLLTVVSNYGWRLRRPEESTASVSIYLDNERLLSSEFSIDYDLLVDEFKPLNASPGLGLPRIHNDLLSGDMLARYGQAVDCGASVL